MQFLTRFSPLALLLCLCLSPVTVDGQASPRAPVLQAAQQTAPQISQLITVGKQFEVEGRWGEALNHYQQALKLLPGNRKIKIRRSIARIHYELNRRYADSNYVAKLGVVKGNNALNLYSEILVKIQSYYVSQPDWDNILRHGLACMEIALSDATFVKHNLPNVDPARIQPVIDEMNSVLGKYDIKTRQDSYLIASNVCRMMQQRLGLPVQTTVYEFTCGAIIALDPYSAFMTSNQYGETMSQIEGNFVGLGVELKTNEDHLQIVNVIANGPAGRSGISSGDLVFEVDGIQVSQLGAEAAADELRGVEGSFVTLGVVKADGSRKKVRLQRRRVDIPSVEGVAIVDRESGIGYLKLSNFQKTTARDFDEALWQLHRQGMRSLIVDVRGNPGGLLNSAVDISDRFINAGVIVSTRGRNPLEDYVHRAKSAGTWRVPLVVLIDGDSASASEIFAAAIKDHQRGIIVGEQSYGKGSVQGIFPLNVGGGGVRLTTARFYSPHGSAISQVGVLPKVPVQTVSRTPVSAAAEGSVDDVLRVGVTIAKRELARQ